MGGFPRHTLTWEDQYVAAKVIDRGYWIAYEAEAAVYHSHHYGLKDEFRRYFDAGAFLKKESWMRQMAGNAEGEGKKFLLEELKYLQQQGKGQLIPYAVLSTAVKYLGYRTGMLEQHLPLNLKQRLSQQPYFWQ